MFHSPKEKLCLSGINSEPRIVVAAPQPVKSEVCGMADEVKQQKTVTKGLLEERAAPKTVVCPFVDDRPCAPYPLGSSIPLSLSKNAPHVPQWSRVAEDARRLPSTEIDISAKEKMVRMTVCFCT